MAHESRRGRDAGRLARGGEDLPFVTYDGVDLCFGEERSPRGHDATAVLDEGDLCIDVWEVSLELAVGELRSESAATSGAVAARAVGSEEGAALQDFRVVR